MSMLDLFFNKGFNGFKCKASLKLTIARIKFLRNKRENQLKHMRKEIAQLLRIGQEATARIRVEHIIREQQIMAAYEIIELFCEFVVVRLPIIETQRECPLDLKESIASLIFAASRCSDLPELLEVQNLFLAKYGKEFVAAATELRPDCGVNRQIIEKLSVRAPLAEVKLKLMKEIAEEHEIDWDSSETETEFFKLHEDLLDAPTHSISGTDVLVPHEEEDESHFTPIKLPNKYTTLETESIIPVVPNWAIPSTSEAEFASETGLPYASSALAPATRAAPESSFSRPCRETLLQMEPIGSDVAIVNIGSPISSPTSSPSASKNMHGEKQFIPFISLSSPLPNLEKEESVSKKSPSKKKSERSMYFEDVLAAAQAAAESAEHAAAAAHAAADLVTVRISELSAKAGYETIKNGKSTSLEDEGSGNFHSNKHSWCVSSPPKGIESKQISTSRRWDSNTFDLNIDCGNERQGGELDLDAYKLASDTMKPLEVGRVHPNLGDSDCKAAVVTESLNIPLYDFPSEVHSAPPESPLEHRASEQLPKLASLDEISYFSYTNLFDAHNSSSDSNQAKFQTLDKSMGVSNYSREVLNDDDELNARLNALKTGN